MTPTPRKQQALKADRMLIALLRTPKTRAGLIAAVTGKSVSRHFVFGWLAQRVASGEVAVHKSSRTPTYQLSTFLSVEPTAEGSYPTWLEPRTLPYAGQRRVFTAGTQVNMKEEQKCD